MDVRAEHELDGSEFPDPRLKTRPGEIAPGNLGPKNPRHVAERVPGLGRERRPIPTSATGGSAMVSSWRGTSRPPRRGSPIPRAPSWSKTDDPRFAEKHSHPGHFLSGRSTRHRRRRFALADPARSGGMAGLRYRDSRQHEQLLPYPIARRVRRRNVYDRSLLILLSRLRLDRKLERELRMSLRAGGRPLPARCRQRSAASEVRRRLFAHDQRRRILPDAGVLFLVSLPELPRRRSTNLPPTKPSVISSTVPVAP